MTLAADVVLPLTYFSFTGAVPAGPGALVKPSVIVAQMLSTGTATAGTRYLVSSAEQAATLFGGGSIAHLMARAFLANHPTAELYVAGIADAVGTNASQTLTFGGTATEAGTVFLRVAGRLVQVSIASGDDDEDAATAAVAAINADTSLPVTAAAVAEVVTITCKHDGTVGNLVTVALNSAGAPDEVLPAGLTAVLGGAVLASGATDPDASAFVTALGQEPFDVVVLQSTASALTAAIKTEMERRWGATVGLQGTAFAAHYATPGDGVTFVKARNDKHLSCIVVDRAKAWLSHPCEYAAAYAAVAALELGADPGRPLQTLPLAGVYVGQQELFTDRNTLAKNGAVVLSVTAGTAFIQAETLTYRTNAFSAEDLSWDYVQKPFLLQRIGRTLKARIESRYPRFKLADNGSFLTSSKVVTPATLKGEIISALQEMEALGYIENLDAWKAGITVVRSTTNPNRVDIFIPADLINQFRVAAFDITFGG
jgi:phage tail sheath gpL-like